MGGSGNDALFGDVGRDTFVFTPGEGADTIFDFAVGHDAIALSADYSYDSLELEYHAGGYTTVSEADSELIVTLIGVEATELSAADFTTV